MTNAHSTPALAQAIAVRYAALPGVVAVALGGSRSTNAHDATSDIDLYVYVSAPLSLDERARLVRPHASYAEVGNDTWEPGDEWVEQGVAVDAMFRETHWIEGQQARVLREHQASVGYSTALWHNVLTSSVLFDRDGWFAELQQAAQQPYPEALRRAIIAKNYPILRETQSSYRQQIAKALARNDLVSVNHRVAALLASYFDVLFAVNRPTRAACRRCGGAAARNGHGRQPVA
jgi:hypothetical protein